jgi:hypothetical protein
VYAPRGVFVNSRTYNLGGTGTFGQAIPALAEGDLLDPGETGVLLKLKSTSESRCNIGFTDFDGLVTWVNVQLYSIGSGSPTLLDEERYRIRPNENRQENEIFEDMGITQEIDEALALVEVESGGSVYVYASSVDDGTGDAEFIPAMKN